MLQFQQSNWLPTDGKRRNLVHTVLRVFGQRLVAWRPTIKSPAKINCRRLTEIISRYYGLSLLKTLTRGPEGVIIKGVVVVVVFFALHNTIITILNTAYTIYNKYNTYNTDNTYCLHC